MAVRKRVTRAKIARGKQYVYTFGDGKAEGRATMTALLGGKGANLAEMASLGLPIPPGFTGTTEVCTYYYNHYNHKDHYPLDFERQVREGLSHIQTIMGRTFGDSGHPLLLSVRSGARVSMPGMMDTVLNLGLNDETAQGLAQQSGSPRFAYDCYRRFVQMYGDVVLGLKPESEFEVDPFEQILEEKKHTRRAKLDTELTAEDLRELVSEFKALIRARLGSPFPEDPEEQLWGAIGAVFSSWNNARAITYRGLYNIPKEWGTAVTVQAMVFGNQGEDCATGVAFTRNPASGVKELYGEFLINAQGEDVVAGTRTPQEVTLTGSQHWAALHQLSEEERQKTHPSLQEFFPTCFDYLEEVAHRLEAHYREMQDIEFTIERGRLWMLQTRAGKRTVAAAVKIAVDMVDEGLIDEKAAVLRVDPGRLDQLLYPRLDPSAPRDFLAQGLPASPGAVSGEVVFSAEEAEAAARGGKKVILVRVETSPEDIHGMNAAQGILTARGGMTSHAALVGRGMGKCCVVGCSDIEIDYGSRSFAVNGRTIRQGDSITLDGSSGEVLGGRVPTIEPQLSEEFSRLMAWVDTLRTLKVRANADTPHDAQVARDFGAEGIGLCRTEHMFFTGERIDAVREMILAEDEEGRRRALSKILPLQKADFRAILRVMAGLPVTVRSLDPPLHEFLPHTDTEMIELARKIGVDPKWLKARCDALYEFNPMLGHRGCRLGMTFPEIYEVQTRALLEAACELAKEGVAVIPEIMVPLVSHMQELKVIREHIDRVSQEVCAAYAVEVPYTVGTMIEVPRAALTADEIARVADFFSFGTNDLTQMTFGLSRDDSGKFLPAYVEQGILPADPFVTLDQQGVGSLIYLAIEKGRASQPHLKVGICGEHGGEPESVKFCHWAGLDYVSCSPYRVPIARLAAAHAALAEAELRSAERKAEAGQKK
jgi:pyruvate,orthophosphate dikinase